MRLPGYAAILWFLSVGSGASVRAQATPVGNPFPVGAKVEVKSSSVWYAATVKEVRGNGRWFIGYDNWSSSWDEEVGPDRIRAKGAAGNAGAPTTSGRKIEEAMAWPARPGRGSTPIEGAYLQVVIYSYPYYSTNYVSWFFTRNGRFSQGPTGGVSLSRLSTKPTAGKGEGTYSVQGDSLVMVWADGRTPWRQAGYKGVQLLPIGAGATRQSAFPRGWRFDGSYEGGASAGGGAVSSSNTLNFRRDGTYTRGSVVAVSSTGRNSEVSGGATGSATGTYEFDEYTMTLRENGTEKTYTVFAYGARDSAGRPERIYWEGGMMKKLNR